MTAYAIDGSVIGSIGFNYSGEPGVNQPDTKSLTGVIDHVVLTPAANDYVAYLGSFTLADSINVSCNTVTRGATVTCNASPANPSDTLVVTGWSFRDSTPDNLVIRQLNPSALSWSGTMAVRGTVVVVGQINGAPASGSTAVQVTARSWTSSMKTVKDHSVIPTTFDSKPDSFSKLGHAELELPHDSNVNRWLGSISDDGPNNGYIYLLDLPPVTRTVSQVNNKAINDTSSFYRKQEQRNKKINGLWFCAKSVVWPGVLRNLSVKHEGAVSPYPSPDTLQNSHPGIFRRHVDSLAYLRYEPIVGFDGQDNASPVTSALFTQASNDSEAMNNDSRNYINTNTLGGCDQFHFGPY